MNTAKELADWCRDSITSLSNSPEYRRLMPVFEQIAERSGLGKQTIANFYYGSKDNPTMKTIDKMVTAIKSMYHEMAA